MMDDDEGERARLVWFRALFEHSPDAIYLYDDEGRIVDVNSRTVDQLGYEREDLVEMDIWDFTSADPKAVKERWAEMDVGDRATFEAEHERADGTTFPVSVRVSHVDFDDEVDFMAIVRDVSDQREREAELERYRRLVQTVGDAMYTLEPDGTIRMANDAMLDRLGAMEEDVVGTHASAFMTEGDFERGTALLEELREETDRRWSTFEITVTPIEGEPFPAEVNMGLLRDGDGDVVGSVGVIRDVTEREEREAELQRQANRLEAFSIAFPDAAFIADREGRFLDVVVGEESEEMLLEDPDELRGKTVHDLFPPDQAATFVETIRTVIDTDEPHRLEYPLEFPEGERWFEARVQALPFSLDGEELAIWVAREITERREREREQGRQRSILRALVESSIDGVLVVDQDRTIVTWNQRFVELWDVPEELLEKRSEEPGLEWALERVVDPEGFLERVEALYDNPRAQAREEVELVDGRVLDRYTAPVVGDDGSLFGRVWFFRDVTEEVERREVLETLHEATRDLMAADDRDEIAAIGSRTAADVLELSINSVNRFDAQEDALVPVAWSAENEELFGGPPPAIPSGAGLVWRALDAGEPRLYDDLAGDEGRSNEETAFRSEMHLPIGDDWVMLVSSDTAGAFDEADLAVARILAANMESALERVAYERDLARQNERLEEFASVVTHDLRNPLSVATGRLEFARDEPGDMDHLDAIEAAHDRMRRIIDDVLWLAREGKDIGETESVDLPSMVRGCWDMLEVDDEEDRLIVAEEASLEPIRADPDRLRQLLENLLRNAREHGGDEVTVTVGSLANGFYVEDDGSGIPDDERERIFEAGYSTGEEGTGFGLSIVDRVASAHGWKVRVTEGTGGGARFEVIGVDRARE